MVYPETQKQGRQHGEGCSDCLSGGQEEPAVGRPGNESHVCKGPGVGTGSGSVTHQGWDSGTAQC